MCNTNTVIYDRPIKYNFYNYTDETASRLSKNVVYFNPYIYNILIKIL